MTDDRKKVEIRLIETEEWQWMGLLSDEQITKLCEYADKLCDGEEDSHE